MHGEAEFDAPWSIFQRDYHQREHHHRCYQLTTYNYHNGKATRPVWHSTQRLNAKASLGIFPFCCVFTVFSCVNELISI
jgi:hypothetical protein